jgi:hypothetical protein
METAAQKPRPWGALLRLWLVLFLSYFALKFVFNLTMVGFIDLRPVFLWEALAVSFGQALVIRLIAARREPLAGR